MNDAERGTQQCETRDVERFGEDVGDIVIAFDFAELQASLSDIIVRTASAHALIFAQVPHG